MAVAGKIYQTHNTPAKLTMLMEHELESAGVKVKEDRKLVMNALRKAGYKPARGAAGRTPKTQPASTSTGPSASTSSTPSPRKKRKRDDVNELLPAAPADEGETLGSLQFNEVLDPEILMSKATVTNRAPLMMAWAAVVAERLGFQREDALSIASVYTEMNAISKGISLGIYGESKEKRRDKSQPYVDLMGRKIPLYQYRETSWRALLNGTPASPAAAYSYITRAFRQTTPHIVGALRLLAEDYSPQQLNERGFGFYADFRPADVGWGEKGKVRCETILSLRRPKELVKAEEQADGAQREVQATLIVKYEAPEEGQDTLDETSPKKVKGMSLEEYEAALDDDPLFDLPPDLP